MRAAGRASLTSFPPGGLAVVVGATGGIGAALVAQLENHASFAAVLAFSRGSAPHLDLTSEPSIAACADAIARDGRDVRLVIDATGILSIDGVGPEKSLREIDPVQMAQAFAINAIGPALLMKHLLPKLPRLGKSVFATLSAKVGSIGDNRLGGWYAYRASKAALNQLVRTAAIEVRRRQPEAICVALHPGTVGTALSAGFAKAGLDVHAPDGAAEHLLRVVDALTSEQSGTFLDWRGDTLPW